jgi:hypothetical protein
MPIPPPKIAPQLANLPHVKVSDLILFQGDLKELSIREYNKLLRSLVGAELPDGTRDCGFGLFMPFVVRSDTMQVLDGHQRIKTYRDQGWGDELVPVVFVDAEDDADAKKKLLVISSQYGRTTQEGWDEFTHDLDLDWLKDTTHFDSLPFVFNDYHFDPPPTLEELEAQYGEEKEDDLWPLIREKVSPETKERWDVLIAKEVGVDRPAKIANLLQRLENE